MHRWARPKFVSFTETSLQLRAKNLNQLQHHSNIQNQSSGVRNIARTSLYAKENASEPTPQCLDIPSSQSALSCAGVKAVIKMLFIVSHIAIQGVEGNYGESPCSGSERQWIDTRTTCVEVVAALASLHMLPRTICSIFVESHGSWSTTSPLDIMFSLVRDHTVRLVEFT